MAKARVGLYNTEGDALVRTHKSCPKCGPGTFLAEHPDRRSCGKCGYSETKAPSAAPVAAAAAPKAKAPSGAPKPKAPAPPAAAKAPAPPKAA
jgi:ubiquitin-small subunit ribosomal protein S27Ae